MQKNIKKEVIALDALHHTDLRLTAAELNLLLSCSPHAYKLYIFLAAKRDFETNIAGEMTRISDSLLKKVMTNPPHKGRKTEIITSTHLNRWLSQLEKCGLIEQKGDNVFYFPLAFCSKKAKSFVTKFVTPFVSVTNAHLSPKMQHNEISEKPYKNSDKTQQIEHEKKPFVTETNAHLSPHLSQQLETYHNKDQEDCSDLSAYADYTLQKNLLEYSTDDDTDHDQENDKKCTVSSKPARTVHKTLDDKYLNIPGTEFSKIFDYLQDLGFPYYKLFATGVTEMIRAWIREGVVHTHMVDGINAANANLGRLPDSARYYLNFVLQAKIDNERILKSTEDTKNARPHNTGYKSAHERWLEEAERDKRDRHAAGDFDDFF